MLNFNVIEGPLSFPSMTTLFLSFHEIFPRDCVPFLFFEIIFFNEKTNGVLELLTESKRTKAHGVIQITTEAPHY